MWIALNADPHGTGGFVNRSGLKWMAALMLALVVCLPQAEAGGKRKKSDRNEAKQACLAKDPGMTGKKLKKCMKQYRK